MVIVCERNNVRGEAPGNEKNYTGKFSVKPSWNINTVLFDKPFISVVEKWFSALLTFIKILLYNANNFMYYTF